MPSNYNFADNQNRNIIRSFDDIFVARDYFDLNNAGGPGDFIVSSQDIEDYFMDDPMFIDNYIGDTLWTWGSTNNSGNLGVNDTTTRSTPVTTLLGGNNWKYCSGGNLFIQAIKTDGTLWAWGAGSAGQLGNNVLGSRLTPITTLLGGTNWKYVESGADFTLAIKTDGTLWTWGGNSTGQLGVNDTTQRNTPVTTILGGTDWKSIAGGTLFAAAIKTNGTLWLWGRNLFGALGVNDTSGRQTPVTTILGGNNWKQISAGNSATGAIKNDGTLWIWGGNNGLLGVNDITNRLTPVTTIFGGNYWKRVNVSNSNSQHLSAIKIDGTLWLCGSSNNGQLGVNDNITRSTPVTTILGGTDWKMASGANNTVRAIKTDGTLWVWGNTSSSAVNDAVKRTTPVTTILGGNNWKMITNGYADAAITAGLNINFP